MMIVTSSAFKINIVIIPTSWKLGLNLAVLYLVELLFRHQAVVYRNLVELVGR